MAEKKGERLWYIIQTYSGKEASVQKALQSRIISCNMQDFIFEVLVPEHTEEEKAKDGTIKQKVVKTFPGYVYVEMIDNEDSWWVVRNTPGVTGFLGSSGKKARPVPVSAEEMAPILKACGMVQAPTLNYKVGDTVTIVSGNFKDQVGVVSNIDLEKMETQIAIELFGRTVEVPISARDVEIVK